METWFLLYGGTSEDGRGDGRYIGRTTDVLAAYKHYRDCAENPYSVGKVVIVTDKGMETAGRSTKWGALTPAPADSANACPKCGCEQTMPTGDGNMIGLCGHVWQAKNQPSR